MNSIYKGFGFLIIIICFIILNASYTTKKDAAYAPTNYSWQQTDSSLTLYNYKDVLWQYNFNTQKGKPFFHPININKTTLTELSPKDHPWHLGIWHSWKYINGVNYWEYDETENMSPWNYKGQTKIKSVIIKKDADFSCVITLNIDYHEKNKVTVLNEKRRIYISAPDKNQLFYIDYNFDFTAITDKVTLDRTPIINEPAGVSWGGYGGLSIRFNTHLLPNSFINSDNTKQLAHEKKGRWSHYELKQSTNNIFGVTIFDHPGNFNYPTPWYVTKNLEEQLYYLGTAPLFNKSHTLFKGEALKFKHRIQFHHQQSNLKIIESQWCEYIVN